MYCHLHVHSWFSLGEGVSSPEVLAEAAATRGFTALACTDTNGVYGAVEFQQAALAHGLRPILGAQLVAGGQEAVALATDASGWAALCRAITQIHWAGRRADGRTGGRSHRRTGGPADRPFSLSAQLSSDREGLLLLSRDVTLLEEVSRISGPRDLYAELRPGKERHAVGAAARKLKISTVATGAVMFAHPEEWQVHRLRVAIAANAAISRLAESPASSSGGKGGKGGSTCRSAGPPVRPSAQDAWLRPSPDLARHFPDCPDALTRSLELAERCQYRIPVGSRVVSPRFACPDDAFERLRALAYAGAEQRYGLVAPVTRDRLERELAIIGEKRFADYFLVVHDIVQHGPTHCGRGSVANSIVSYCLGITHVDPLGAGLLFERFLNPERKDPPDIDLDFPWDERDSILAWVFRRYPHPRAAMVANHNCFRLRGALREVAKVHGRPPGEIREITRRFPWFMEEDSIGDVLAKHPNFSQLDLPAVWQDLARMAQPLVGVPRHLSLHPGGVVIVPDALTDFVPVEPAAKVLDGNPDLTVPVIQFEKDGAEDAGLVKIDLLGNRSLAVIRDAIAEVRVNTGIRIDYTSSDPEDDEPTRELFRTGRTMGVFYTESPASRLLCAKSRADTFELLVLNTSIIRPASNRFIRIYLERLHGAPYQPLDPSLRDTLAETFGVMVYQEDVVNVCATFAGMPLSSGDGLRKALSKKRPVKQLAAYAEEFFSGAARLGRDLVVAKQVWEMVMSFAGYSFCKGHSCSYIRVAQHSCYLRAHHPAEFMAGVLANGGGFYHPFAYVAEAMRMGLTVRPPDVNASRFRTTGRDREVQIGFQFIKGLSADAVEKLEAGRTGGLADERTGGPADRRTDGRTDTAPCHPEGAERPRDPSGCAPEGIPRGSAARDDTAEQPFVSFEDFRARTQLRHDDLRLLIQVGACDSIAGSMTRPMLLWEVDSEATNAERGSPSGRNAERQLLPPVRRSAGPPALREYSPDRRRRTEYELLGFTTDSHPMDLYREQLAGIRVVPTTDLARYVGQSVLCAGMLTTAKPVHTVKDEPMEFATFDDGHGLIEAVLFPDIYRRRGHVLFDQGPFLFRGKVEEEFGALTVTMTQLDRLDRVLAKAGGRTGGRAGRR
jgi:DNA polymerase III alpha subunit